MIQEEKRMVREEKILLRLDDLGYATRKHLQVMENLGGDRNASRVLKRMEKESKVIQSDRRECKVFYLTHKGKEVIGSTKDVKFDRGHVKHALMRNDLYIQLGMPDDWRTEAPINYGKEERLIPDAVFTRKQQWHFVEVDNQQTMKYNLEKLHKYAELLDSFERQYGHRPNIIYCTLSENRKMKLDEAMVKLKVHGDIYVL